MKLRDLFGDDAAIDPRAEAVVVTGLAVDSRAVKPGDVFFALAGSRTDGARFIDQAIACRRGGNRGRPYPARRPAGAFCRHAESTPGAGACRGAILSAAARDHRGRHRHQRQDLGRGLHPADLAGARPCLGQHRHHRAGVAKAHRLRIADDAGSDCAAPRSSMKSRPMASPIWRSRRRRMGSISTGWTASGSAPAASPTCRAITWTIIPTSRIILPPSCGCSAISSRRRALR